MICKEDVTFLRRCGLKHHVFGFLPFAPVSSPSYEGVDWNRADRRCNRRFSSHLLTKVWIETLPTWNIIEPWVTVTFLRRCGLKHCCIALDLDVFSMSPSYEGVDWNSWGWCIHVWLDRVTFLRRCGLKLAGSTTTVPSSGSPSYEGVDWNSRNWV